MSISKLNEISKLKLKIKSQFESDINKQNQN